MGVWRWIRRVGMAMGMFGLLVWDGPAQAAETWTLCVPVQIMNYSTRIHVRCAASVGGIQYFAVTTQDPQLASRVLSVISTAQVAGRTLTILYDPADTSGGDVGCQTGDCRLIRAVGFGQ